MTLEFISNILQAYFKPQNMKIKSFIISILAIIGMSVNAQNAYITNIGDSTVSVINLATNTVTATIAVGNSPEGICASPNGKKVYVVNAVSLTISIINTATNTVSATIPVPVDHSLSCIAASPDGSRLYVLSESGSEPGKISIINTNTNSVELTVEVNYEPCGLSVSPDGSKVYTTYKGNESSIRVINTKNNNSLSFIYTNDNPNAIAVSSDGNYVYVAKGAKGTINGAVDVISSQPAESIFSQTKTAPTATITVGLKPWGYGNQSRWKKNICSERKFRYNKCDKYFNLHCFCYY